MSNASLKAVMPLMFLASCVTTHPTHYWCTPNSMVAVSIEEALQQNPLATNQEIRIVVETGAGRAARHI